MAVNFYHFRRHCRESKRKRSLGSFELLEHLTDRYSTGDSVSINTTANFFTFKIVNSKNWVAAKPLVESFVLGWVTAERVDEHRHEVIRSRDYLSVSKRTACEISTACSAWVFTEVQPHRSIGLPCVGQSIVVVHVPVY